MYDNNVRFQASQAPIHDALLKGASHRSGSLEHALASHRQGEAALEFDTAPFLQGRVIRDGTPALTLPAHIQFLPHSYES